MLGGADACAAIRVLILPPWALVTLCRTLTGASLVIPGAPVGAHGFFADFFCGLDDLLYRLELHEFGTNPCLIEVKTCHPVGILINDLIAGGCLFSFCSDLYNGSVSLGVDAFPDFVQFDGC